ncbi:MAG: hypothetical protein IPM92_07910 [Saprospiraceae bacterium]|nr:hypothetical protein [Saprospiraceae bacterium]
MKWTLYLLALIVVPFIGCGDDDDHGDEFEYHAHIHSPSDSAFYDLNQNLEIEVEFESHTGNTVHHINIQIIDLSSNAVIYNKPDDAHVHETSGNYNYLATLGLSAANGFTAGKSYKFVAKVWGHEDGESEEISEVVFQIRN